MPVKLYKVTLTTEERAELTALVSRGSGNVRRLRRARILLLADENQPEGAWKDADIAKALSAHARTVERTRENVWNWASKRHLTTRDHKRTRSRILDGAAEARLAQLACSGAPDGHERWTMQMLADKLIEVEVV